jgi:endonuclease/exonuclease/phosphatase family metal-dependent hydrolase
VRKSRFVKRWILEPHPEPIGKTPGVELTILSWNLFHGRDFPPDPALFTWRSRLLGTSERGATHVQVNRELLDEFATVLAEAAWDVALLQECPPRWWEPLAAACGAASHGVLTSRNSLGELRAHFARQNPDLLASAEGGSNLTLLRCSAVPLLEITGQRNSGTPEVVGRGEMEIHTGRPERRAVALTRLARGAGGAELCVANLHATNDRPDLAAEDVLRAAAAAADFAGDAPLIFGGDLNLRPAESRAVFDELRERFGLAAPTGPDAIDHLLTRDLETVAAPLPWPSERRELREDGLALRLSDHAPVEARFATREAW